MGLGGKWVILWCLLMIGQKIVLKMQKMGCYMIQCYTCACSWKKASRIKQKITKKLFLNVFKFNEISEKMVPHKLCDTTTNTKMRIL